LNISVDESAILRLRFLDLEINSPSPDDTRIVADALPGYRACNCWPESIGTRSTVLARGSGVPVAVTFARP